MLHRQGDQLRRLPANRTCSILPTPDEATMDMEPPTKPDERGEYPIPLPGTTSLDDLPNWSNKLS